MIYLVRLLKDWLMGKCRQMYKLLERLWQRRIVTLEQRPEAMPIALQEEGSEHLKEKMQYAYECYKYEMERKKTVEGKASMFIATITFVATVLIGLSTRQIIVEKESSFLVFGMKLVLALAIVFVLRTLWFSIKALERRGYYYLAISDFRDERGDDFYKKVISELNEAICKNQPVTNRKSDYITVAQYSFKTALGFSIIYVFALIAFLIYSSVL